MTGQLKLFEASGPQGYFLIKTAFRYVQESMRTKSQVFISFYLVRHKKAGYTSKHTNTLPPAPHAWILQYLFMSMLLEPLDFFLKKSVKTLIKFSKKMSKFRF